MDLQLVTPSVSFKDSYLEHVSEFQARQERFVPFSISYNTDDFEALVQKYANERAGVGVPDEFVPSSTFWLTLGGKEVVGVSNLRHALTERLRKEGGHIGYGIRPSFRGRGFGKEILRLTLYEAQQLGINKALITCNKSNAASAGVILANGGVFEGEEFVESYGDIVQRYWISLPSS